MPLYTWTIVELFGSNKPQSCQGCHWSWPSKFHDFSMTRQGFSMTETMWSKTWLGHWCPPIRHKYYINQSWTNVVYRIWRQNLWEGQSPRSRSKIVPQFRTELNFHDFSMTLVTLLNFNDHKQNSMTFPWPWRKNFFNDFSSPCGNPENVIENYS